MCIYKYAYNKYTSLGICIYMCVHTLARALYMKCLSRFIYAYIFFNDGIFVFSNIYYPSNKMVTLDFSDSPRYHSTPRRLKDNLACPSTKSEINRQNWVFLKTFCFHTIPRAKQKSFLLNPVWPQLVCRLCFGSITDTLIQTNVPQSSWHLKPKEELKW